VGEKQNQPFQPAFNACFKVDFQASRVTSDGGLIVVRELDERLGLGELIERLLLAQSHLSRRLFGAGGKDGEVSVESVNIVVY
jgi:hypothetical protein